MILEKRLPLKYLLGNILLDIALIATFSIIIHFIARHLIKISLPISLGAFLGTAISLVLSFKISQSYDRWWEARKIWGAIVNDSRTLTIQLMSFLPANQQQLIRTITFRQIGWCYALGQSLRRLNPTENLNDFISEEELNQAKKHKNVPLKLIQQHSLAIKTAYGEQLINDFQQIQLDNTLARLCASMGMAERIKGTVFPKTYRLTLHFFIYLFLVILSLSLTELSIFVTVPLLIFIAIPFFLLEKIAFYMQDPFENRPTDTAMTAIARTIEINLKQLLDEKEVPEPLPADKFYML